MHDRVIFDADNHLYEEPEVLSYLPDRHRNDIQFVQVRGRTRIAIKGRITEYMPNPTFERVARPGAHVAYYSGRNVDGRSLREMTGDPIDCQPEFRDPTARLAAMEAFGVQWALNFPTLANLIEFSLDGDPDLTHVAIHAVNAYLHDRWTFDTVGRIFTVPVITMCELDQAVAEFEWVLARGARAILVRPAPVTGYHGSRSLALPEFDPFWARVEEAGIPVCMHAAFAPLSTYYERWEPNRTDSAFAPTPLKQLLLQHREIEDALAAMICHGALSRFPDLRILSVENGAGWVGHLLGELDLAYRRMPQSFSEHPVEVFKRNVYVNPFWEDDVAALVGLVGNQRVCFGSDYPHPEGLEQPGDFYSYLQEAGVDSETETRIMRSNAQELLHVAG